MLDPQTFGQQEPLTRNSALPFVTPSLPTWLSKQDHHHLIALTSVMGSITIYSRSKNHPSDLSQVTLRVVDLLNPTSRWMSAHRVVWLPGPQGCECQARSGCMHAYARPSFKIIAFKMPLGCQLILAAPHRPRAAGQNEGMSPALAFYRPACMHRRPTKRGRCSQFARPQQGLDTRQTAVREDAYWRSASPPHTFSSTVSTITKYLIHWLKSRQIAVLLAWYGHSGVFETFLFNFLIHIELISQHLKADILPCRPKSTEPDVELPRFTSKAGPWEEHVLILFFMCFNFGIRYRTARKKVSPGTKSSDHSLVFIFPRTETKFKRLQTRLTPVVVRVYMHLR